MPPNRSLYGIASVGGRHIKDTDQGAAEAGIPGVEDLVTEGHSSQNELNIGIQHASLSGIKKRIIRSNKTAERGHEMGR